MIIAIIGCLIVIVALVLFVIARQGSDTQIAEETVNDTWEHPLWDMHCHILPNVDDGADCMQTALDMIYKEVREGVTDIMLTPHYITGKTDNQKILERYHDLLMEVKTREYPVRLYLGNELLYDADTINALREGRAYTLGGTSYVLVEFATNIPYTKMKNDFTELLMAGYRPILAHVERFSCLWEKEERIEELIQQGVLIQVNSNSFIKDKTSNFLTHLAEEGMVHFVGTDSHSMDWRPPQMKKTLRHLKTKLREEELVKLFSDNPHKLLNNKFI